MSLLPDWKIRQLSDPDINPKPMITPFIGTSIKKIEVDPLVGKMVGILSYGLSSAGYDIRLSPNDLKVFTNINAKLVDPRKVDPDSYIQPKILQDEEGLDYVILPPNTVMLGHTEEWFNIPRNILATCMAKSTYARVGVQILVTPLEPEWSGRLVVEISSNIPSPVKIYPGQGIGQLLFYETDGVCEVSYADRGGKYQNQTGTQDAIV